MRRRGAAVIGNGETAGWWSSLPADRVTRLRGASERELAESANPLPADAPAIVFFTVDEPASRRSADLVEMVVTSLETAAVDSTALWLPEFEHNAGTSTLERRAARTSAVRLAADSAHFGPYIAALAESASSGRPIRRAVFTVETRAAGSARALAAAHGRDVVALVLVVPDAVDADFVSTAAEWLCAHARAGVWLTGDGSSRMDRFPSVSVRAPEVPAGVSTVLDRFRPLSYPPIAGHPHPASDPEKRLYRALDQHEWATGREHNRSIRLGELSRPFTVDVLWRTERVIVEIDGDEHRAAQRFAEDRVRDNQLQTHGYMVLRFTNAQVIDDPHRAVATIREAVSRRRSKGDPR
ncbi:endonuclease domain-containing protein [Rhodococcoides fascians]|uniref:endonuclease domain-containing protein n=1 Tax=Rhodococcoides fascians TaxID=1828 RepID=UPI00211AC0BD|nr:endonuclease domain-containing protein [Rhodococcus fascians]